MFIKGRVQFQNNLLDISSKQNIIQMGGLKQKLIDAMELISISKVIFMFVLKAIKKSSLRLGNPFLEKGRCISLTSALGRIVSGQIPWGICD